MAKQVIIIMKCFIIFVAVFFMHSCKKEHLQPALPPSGNPEPLIYFTAKLDSDSVSFAGGINNYVGIPSVFDTNNYRSFNFTLQNPQLPQSYFKISINNYQSVLGNPQSDLDSSVFPGTRSYDPGSLFFLPLSVSVYWIDASGVQFKSATTVPNNFSITSVEDIVYDSKNYKKATLLFECSLSHNNGAIHLTNGKATVLFSVN